MARIVVIEDDPELGALIADYLNVLGHEATSWHSIARARASLETAEVIVTDVSLDGESGLDLCRVMSEDMPVIVVSGDPANSAPAMIAGASTFLLKPVDVVALGDLVDSLFPSG